MKVIRCAKCNDEYKGTGSFEQVAEANDLKGVGNNTFYCKSCLPNIAEEMRAKGSAAKYMRLRKENKQVISNELQKLT